MVMGFGGFVVWLGGGLNSLCISKGGCWLGFSEAIGRKKDRSSEKKNQEQ